MTAGHGHFDGALDVSLAFHVAEIDVVILVRGEKFAQITRASAEAGFPPRKNSNVCRRFCTP